uniref:Nuclear receptor domain-containing protein n=1 Tax=Caenorhabditis tropicalis TaxID=1561998 RepID=A0A1I7UFG4_9PELO
MNSDIEKRMDEWFRVHRIFSDDDGSPQIQSNEEEEDLDDVADSLDEWFIRNEPSQKLKETEEMDYEETVIQENNGTTVIPSQCAGCGKKAVGIKYEVPHCADCQVVPFEEYETDGSLQYDRSVGTEGASHEAGDPLPIMAEQYEPAPVNPNLPNFMPGLSLCIVCGGNAIGIKFGVLSCKGCEDFFRRMHTYQLSCLKESKCDIKFKTKRRCPYCYLQKCRLMGMSFDGFTDDNTNSILRRKNAVNRLTDVRLAEKKQRNDREIIEVLDKGFLNNLLRLGPICNHPVSDGSRSSWYLS